MRVRNEVAADHFKSRKIPYDESNLIEVLQSSQDKFDLLWAAVALRELGTVRAIPALKGAVKFKSLDVQGNAALTTAFLADGGENGFLASLLSSKEYRAKFYAMTGILYKEDTAHSALPLVLEYSAKATKGGKALAKTPCEGLDWLYLARYGAHLPQAQEVFDKINKNRKYVDETVFTRLAGEFPQIFTI
ncbi:hypothetical protein CAMSH0001_2050 [Campylobacter showae RM3277]|uniref:Uncharacterized protein n=2 Tax=Campylobacter showae TaxID=204 RepID=C6REF8_9BACT|nr:hypothetical protein CAMSH0001_2050 [Campylobacter showae RM3277]